MGVVSPELLGWRWSVQRAQRIAQIPLPLSRWSLGTGRSLPLVDGLLARDSIEVKVKVVVLGIHLSALHHGDDASVTGRGAV